MTQKPLPKDKNIYDTDCPILYAMEIIGQNGNFPFFGIYATPKTKHFAIRNWSEKLSALPPQC